MSISQLPTLNAIFNLTSTIFLVAGFLLIRRRNINAHRFCMIAAFSFSIAFLVSYVIYHLNAGSVPYTGAGWLRTMYFIILITHIILAAIVPFLAVITLYRALKQNWPKHKKLAAWTLPIWLYVSITGVVIYCMLYL